MSPHQISRRRTTAVICALLSVLLLISCQKKQEAPKPALPEVGVVEAAVIEVQSLYQLIVLTPQDRAVFRPVQVGERIAGGN